MFVRKYIGAFNDVYDNMYLKFMKLLLLSPLQMV